MTVSHNSLPYHLPPIPSQVQPLFWSAQAAGVTDTQSSMSDADSGFSWTKENLADWVLGDLDPWC